MALNLQTACTLQCFLCC